MSIRKLAVLVFNKNIFVMEHTMVSFDELASAEKRLLLKKKCLIKIAEYYEKIEDPLFKDLSVKVHSNLQTLTEGLAQKISNEHNSTEVFDIA